MGLFFTVYKECNGDQMIRGKREDGEERREERKRNESEHPSNQGEME